MRRTSRTGPTRFSHLTASRADPERCGTDKHLFLPYAILVAKKSKKRARQRARRAIKKDERKEEQENALDIKTKLLRRIRAERQQRRTNRLTKQDW